MEYFGVKSMVESFIRNSQIVISNLITTNYYIPFNIKEIIKNSIQFNSILYFPQSWRFV